MRSRLQAYNGRDLERFIDCYSPDVVIEDGDGKRLIEGHEAHAEITNRIRVGSVVVDEERISGLSPDGSELRAIVAYRLEGDKIVHVRFLT